MFALIDAESQVVQSYQTVRLLCCVGDIRFEEVWFRYSDKEPVLCDFNLHIPPGETYRPGRAHRGGKIVDRETDRPFL